MGRKRERVKEGDSKREAGGEGEREILEGWVRLLPASSGDDIGGHCLGMGEGLLYIFDFD